jgi:methionyl-tRNA formyltransferase
MTTGRVCIAGGVKVNDAVTMALYRAGVAIGQLIGYGIRRSSAAGYYDVMATNAKTGFALPVLCLNDINQPYAMEALRANPCDLLLVTGWSQIFPKAMLDLFPLGAVGLHPTLLPEGRGRAPIPHTILRGLRRSGVTMFYLGPGADDGDVVGQEEFDVDADETATTLYDKVCEASARLCVEMVPRLLAGTAPRVRQNHALATVWGKRTPEDSGIHNYRAMDDDTLWRITRALERPYPQAHLVLNTSNGPRKVYLSTVERA